MAKEIGFLTFLYWLDMHKKKISTSHQVILTCDRLVRNSKMQYPPGCTDSNHIQQ